MKISYIMKVFMFFVGLFLLNVTSITAQCTGSDDLAVKALTVQPSSAQKSCRTATIIAQWEVLSQSTYLNACHESTLTLAIPAPFLGTTGTITIEADDGMNYFEPQSGWEIQDNSIKIDLLPNAEIPFITTLTLTVADMEILDDMDYNSQNITMSISHADGDANSGNDSRTKQTSTEVADEPVVADIQANCTGTDLAIDLTTLPGSTNGGAITDYSWTGPNGFTSSVEDPSFTVAANEKEAYTGDYMVTVTDANGCMTMASISLDGSNCLALPVEWLTFTASPGKDNVKLTWKTATELNNHHFGIERSADGRNFIKIGEVAGSGTTSEVVNYSFTDDAPLSGKSYFRLKQIDFSGAYEYSHVEEVLFGGDSLLKVYPNPVATGYEINILGKKIQSVKVYNVLGQLIINEAFERPRTNVIISSGRLTQGIYVTKVNGVHEKRVVVK